MNKDINTDGLDEFIGITEEPKKDKKKIQEKDRSIIEVVGKTIITEDGRQLLT